ncbi:uncharacterized protein [Epargyreus clarus]|uniref:uncharacterized protein isoform X3 n=1 Tax=Epargyreus clarus TaxID=520877 RepID=UPI003C2DD2A5
MTERDNNIEKLLSLTEYPSSSDDENTPQLRSTLGWHQQQTHQAQTSRDEVEVINVDESSMPNIPSSDEQVLGPTPSPVGDNRREQARADHNLYWYMIDNPMRMSTIGVSRLISRMAPDFRTGSESRTSASGSRPAVPEPRAIVHEPVPELSQPRPRPSASADIQSIMAFKRLQRYRSYRHNRVSSLGYVSRHPVLMPLPREHSSRTPSRRIRPTSSVTLPGFERNTIMLSLFGRGRGEDARSAAGQNDAEDNSNEASEDGWLFSELDNVQFQQLSQSPPPEDTPNDNSENMEVDAPRSNSAAEVKAGDGEESAEESGSPADVTPATDAAHGLASNESGNANDERSAEIRRQLRRQKRREAERQGTEAFDVKEFNQNLLRLLECPVCLEWMEPPMWQCRRGHLVCGRCRARLASCPVCRTGFSTVRNRAMEGVAELLRYPCRHGCGREARLRRRAAHEASCAARRYRCPATACADRAPLPFDDLSRHIQRNHSAMVRVGRIHKFSVKVNAEQHDNWLLLAGFGLFHLRIDVDICTSGVVLMVAYIGPKCRAKEFTYEVTVIGRHNGRKLVYTRATHSDLESSSVNVSRQDCFRLTLDQAINFLRFRNREPDRVLDFNVEISKQEVMIANNSSANASDD